MRTQSSAGQSAGLPPADLELVNYGAGHAWLRRELDVAIVDAAQLDQDLTRLLNRCPQSRSEPENHRYVLTDLGRRALAMEALFGQPWPTVAEAHGLDQQGAA